MKAHKLTKSFLVLTFLLSCNLQVSNKYEFEEKLGVISNPRMYQKMVETDSNKQLVDLEQEIPGIVLDIHYATRNNFTGKKIYNSPKAFLRKPVAKALASVRSELNSMGLDIKVFDAYRPYSATVKFYEVYPDTNFVAAPWSGSKHNRGCAVDLTLINIETGVELMMPTPFDDFTLKAAQDYADLPEIAIKNRELLRNVMIKHGFSIYPHEWWHYDFVGWENFELMNIAFEDL